MAHDEANGTSHFMFTVGVGAEADNDFLRRVGKSGSAAVADAAALAQALTDIGTKIREQAGRHYLLEYCSPKRSGSHEVTVTATANGATGSVTAGFSASGFISGCTL